MTAARNVTISNSTLLANAAAGGDGGALCFIPPTQAEAIRTCVTKDLVVAVAARDRFPDGEAAALSRFRQYHLCSASLWFAMSRHDR